MIIRPKEAYTKKFKDYDLEIVHQEEFNPEITEGKQKTKGCHAWILKTET